MHRVSRFVCGGPFESRRRRIIVILLGSVLVSALSSAAAANAPPRPDTPDQEAIEEAARWIERQDKIETEYHYVMTAKLRFLLFWAGRDDVGGGYVRIGKASSKEGRQEMIQILFGSDPAKVPLSINRWGAGTEVVRSGDSGPPVASAFFGFMKSAKGQSVMAMEKELSREKSNGDHLFEGIISRVDDGRALSTTVPYSSSRDFDLHQYAEAEKATLQQLQSNPARQIHRLDGAARQSCPRAGEFLSTTLQLIDDAVAGHPTPVSLCYIYNARHYTATLLSTQAIAEKTVHIPLRGNGGVLDQTYHHLQEARFVVVGEETGAKSSFEILLGTEGTLRGAPIQVIYQPNWWFQAILNLMPDSSLSSAPGTASR